MYPNVIQIMDKPGSRRRSNAPGVKPEAPQRPDLKYITRKDGEIFIHPTSVIFNEPKFERYILRRHILIPLGGISSK
jgi:hypothetical protein